MLRDALSASDFAASWSSHVDTPTAPDGARADFITIPDAHFLFSAEFKRVGNDLKLTGEDGKSLLLSDYFKSEHHASLRSPDGATLSPDIVDALAGPANPGQFAQATAPQSDAQAIGRVASVSGSASVVRNGVTIQLNPGDPILKNDVAQTGSGSALGITFADGSTFNLTANARIVVNEFVYEPNGTANAQLVNLVQGAASFVAGQIAKTGDMKVGTPVATMGIRGTAVILDISSTDGHVSISVIDQRDNQTHTVEIFDRAGTLIGRAVSSGGVWMITPTASLQALAQEVGKTPQQVQQEFATFQTLLNTYDAAKQYFPSLPDHSDAGPKTNPGAHTQFASDSSFPQLLKSADFQTIDVSFTPPSPQSSHSDNPVQDFINHRFDDLPPPVQFPLEVPVYNFIYGTDDDDNGDAHPVLEGTDGNDWIFGYGGDDIIIAGQGGNNLYDGGGGNDTLTFVNAAHGIVFNLYTIDGTNTADGPDSSHSIFTNIENIVGGAGDDTFIMHAKEAWQIDGGDGIDTIRLEGSFDIRSDEGPEVRNVEIVDLGADTGANTVDIDALGIWEMNDAHTVRILGGSNDHLHLTNSFEGQGGYWVRVAQNVHTSDGATDDILFDRYEFIRTGIGEGQGISEGQNALSEGCGNPVAYVQVGVDVTLESSPPTAQNDVFLGVPNGWQVGANGHQYKYVADNFISWQGAVSAAVAAGGYLATIGDDDENNLIFSLVKNHVAWLGGSDRGHEGHWQWTTEPGGPTDFSYTHWASGEPNNLLNEDYLVTWGNHSWNDIADNLLTRLIIEGYVIERDGDPDAHYLQVTEDAPVSIDTALLLANDSDPDGDPLSVTSVSGTSAHGAAVTLNCDGTITYDARQAADIQALSAGESMEDTFTYMIDDGHGGHSTATVTLTVNGLNDAPDAPAFTPNANIAQAANNTSLLSHKVIGSVHATDVDTNDTVTYSLDRGSSRGFSLSDDGVLSVGNSSLSSKTYTLDIAATDSSGASSHSSLTVWVGSSQNNTVSFADSSNPVIVFGLNGNDRITGSNQNDVFIGGGGTDTFVFRPNNGQDVIADFSQAQHDRIDLQAFAEINDIMSHVSVSGTSSVIDLGGGNTITVQNSVDTNHHSTLTANDFILHAGV